MARPMIMVLEPEPSEALCVRKLVVETAKFNVATAHSTAEAKQLLSKFLRIDCMVMVAGMKGADEASSNAKSVNPLMPIIFLSANQNYRSTNADYYISSHEPQQLVNLLRSLLGDPRTAA